MLPKVWSTGEHHLVVHLARELERVTWFGIYCNHGIWWSIFPLLQNFDHNSSFLKCNFNLHGCEKNVHSLTPICHLRTEPTVTKFILQLGELILLPIALLGVEVAQQFAESILLTALTERQNWCLHGTMLPSPCVLWWLSGKLLNRVFAEVWNRATFFYKFTLAFMHIGQKHRERRFLAWHPVGEAILETEVRKKE